MTDELKEEEIESPYCECRACGESGCCSPFMCLSASIKKNPTCKYGESYLSEIKVNYDFADWVLDYVDKNGSIKASEANRKYRELLDTEFNNDTVYNKRSK